MLRKYGQVYKCQNHYRLYGKYTNLKKTGDRIIWMKLHDYIPQLLNINKTEISSLRVSYQKQPLSCNTCGHTGHKAWRCVRKPRDYKNVIDLDDGYDNSEEKSDMEDSVKQKDDGYDDGISVVSFSTIDENVDDTDVHMDPSQNRKTFKCLKCEYECNYENIYNEHIKFMLRKTLSYVLYVVINVAMIILLKNT